jgi:hypothetical protein
MTFTVMNDQIPPGIPGVDAPEGFTKNYITIFKGYFCKYVCQKEWDNFYEEDILMNKELRDNARAVINEQNEGEFRGALYDSNAGYALLVRYVLDSLVNQALFKEEREEGRHSVYLRTDKLKALCPEILRVILPVIDSLVEEYDRQQKEQELR